MAIATLSATYDPASQTVGHTYDALGRLTSDGSRTFVWDLASRLTSVTGMATVNYQYDAMGHQIVRDNRKWIWNYATGLSSVAIVRDNLDNDLFYYIYTPEGRLVYSVETATGTRRDYHFDEMGNTVIVSNPAGGIDAQYAYGPYGEALGSTASLENPFTWQGMWGAMDQGSNLYYLRARYFDSGLRRFLSRDPIVVIAPKGMNPYQYGSSNPLRFIDPRGLEPDKVQHIKDQLKRSNHNLL